MDKNIAEFLQYCGTCHKTKLRRTNPPNLLTPSLVCSKIHQRVHLDMTAAPVASWQQQQIHFEFHRCIPKICQIQISGYFWQNTRNCGKSYFHQWICWYGVLTEIITNWEKVMKQTPETRNQFPTFYFQEKTANRTINIYLKQIFELRTTDWEIYLARWCSATIPLSTRNSRLLCTLSFLDSQHSIM